MHVFNSWLVRLFMVYCLMLWPLVAGAEAPGVRTKLNGEQILAFVPPARGGLHLSLPL